MEVNTIFKIDSILDPQIANKMNTSVYTEIKKSISQLDTTTTPQERKEILQLLIDFIQEKVNKKEVVNLNFICTHNSRRSHLSQIWAQVAATNYNIPTIYIG